MIHRSRSRSATKLTQVLSVVLWGMANIGSLPYASAQDREAKIDSNAAPGLSNRLTASLRSAVAAEEVLIQQIGNAQAAAAKARGQQAGVERFANIAQEVQRAFDEGEANAGRSQFNQAISATISEWQREASARDSEAERLRQDLSSAIGRSNELLLEFVSSSSVPSEQTLKPDVEELRTQVERIRQDLNRSMDLAASDANAHGVIDGAQRFQDMWYAIFFAFDTDEAPWARDGSERRAGKGWKRRTEEEILAAARETISASDVQRMAVAVELPQHQAKLGETLGRIEHVLAAQVQPPQTKPNESRDVPPPQQDVPSASPVAAVPANSNPLQAHQMWIGLGFAAFLVLFLVVAFFTKAQMSDDQRQILRFLCALCAGFSGALLTGDALFRMNAQLGQATDLAILGTAGCALFFTVWFTFRWMITSNRQPGE